MDQNLKATTRQSNKEKSSPTAQARTKTAVIIRADFAKKTGNNRQEVMPRNARESAKTIRIWNLDNKQKTGRLVVKGGTLEGLRNHTLPPRGKRN